MQQPIPPPLTCMFQVASKIKHIPGLPHLHVIREDHQPLEQESNFFITQGLLLARLEGAALLARAGQIPR